jgi:hypothetical protein
MQTRFKIISIYIATIFIATSCQKDVDFFIPDTTQPIADTSWANNITDTMPVAILQASLLKAPSVDSVFIDSVAPTTYVANNGLKFFIRPNILVPALGVAPIAGLVSIEHVLLKKRGDFISANVPTTTTANQLLESGAAVFIKIKKGNAMLQTLPTATIGINIITTPFTSNGQLYYTSSPFYNWLVNPNPNQNIVTTTTQGFEIATNTFGWLQVANTAAAGTVNIIAALDSQFTNKNTSVFLSVNGKISIVKFEGNRINKTFNSIAQIAQGKEVTVITISKIANKYYIGSKVFVTQNVAGSANQLIQIQPQISSLQQITTYLQAL